MSAHDARKFIDLLKAKPALLRSIDNTDHDAIDRFFEIAKEHGLDFTLEEYWGEISVGSFVRNAQEDGREKSKLNNLGKLAQFTAEPLSIAYEEGYQLSMDNYKLYFQAYVAGQYKHWTFARKIRSSFKKCEIGFPEDAQADSLKQPTRFQVSQVVVGVHLRQMVPFAHTQRCERSLVCLTSGSCSKHQ